MDSLNNAVKDGIESFVTAEESDRKQSLLLPSQIVLPRTITGPANSLNKGAIAWSHHGLMAYGSHCTVMVIDTKNVQIVQSLDKHKSIVKKILWVLRAEAKSDGSASLQLLSGDSSGYIHHWEVTSGTVISTLQDGNKPVLGMEWVPGLENELMVAALHAPYFLIIWDVKKQTKLWKKSFTDTLLSFDFNPFDGTKLAFLCPDCILFVDDFQISKIPSTNGRKFYISTPRLDSSSDDNLRGRDRLKKLMKGLVVGETKPKPDEAMTITECLQLTYHRSLRHHLILLYPRDVILIDLHINQTVGVIPIERTMSPLIQIITSRQRDVLYCLHESGSISAKSRKKPSIGFAPTPIDGITHNSNPDFGTYSSDMFMSYEHKCQSEVIRQVKTKVLGMCLDPITERKIGLFLSSGKVIFLELEECPENMEGTKLSLADIIPTFRSEKSLLRLIPVGILSTINGVITIVRMCPNLTSRNRQHYIPLLAVGTSTGYLYIFNVSQGVICKELIIHLYPIRGLEWTGLRSIITYAYGDGQRVKNEIYLTDICTGQSVGVRTNHPAETPISILRVSPLRQYFVVFLKDGPLELWQLSNLSLLRTMPKKFPNLVALEWSPVYSSKSIQSKKKQSELDLTKTDSASLPAIREYIVMTDIESYLYHFSVQGDCVKDGIKIPPENGNSLVTSIAFKANQLVQGDMDGMLHMWDLKARSSRNVSTNHGTIRHLRFAPGKINLKLMILYTDSVEIVDLKNNQFEKISFLKWGRENGHIVDVDWASSDLLIIATEDGWVRIVDITLSHSSSPMQMYNFKDPLCCPGLLPPKIFARVEFLLATQYWKETAQYSEFTVPDGFLENDLTNVNVQLKHLNIDSNFGGLNVAEKCLRTCQLLGDSYGVDLWTVVIYYLQVAAAEKDLEPKSELKKNNSTSSDLKRVNKHPNIEPLDSCYDYLMDPYSYQKLELERVFLHEWKRGDYQHTQKVVERLVLLGEMDRAVQLLLETDIDNPNYYTDAIKACLVATIQQTGAAQSTIKLVATNLIANGKIWEGVQLLCLIGKGLDGCRYLMSSGMWEQAVWLAKSTLPPAETLEVMKKFSDHLVSTGDRFAAILVLISQCQFEKALEMLYSQHQVWIGALLLMSCQHYGVEVNQHLTVAIHSSLHDYLQSIGNQAAADALAQHLKIPNNSVERSEK